MCAVDISKDAIFAHFFKHYSHIFIQIIFYYYYYVIFFNSCRHFDTLNLGVIHFIVFFIFMLFSIYTFKILVYVFQVMGLFVGHLSRRDLLLLYAQNEDSNSNMNLFVDSDV